MWNHNYSTVVVTDLDDTLFPERDYVASGFEAVGELLHRQFGCTGFAEIAFRLFTEGERSNIFNLALSELQSPDLWSSVPSLVQAYRAHWPHITLYPDAKEFLERMSKRASLALLSDGPLISQVNKAKALGTAQWCSVQVFTDFWGRASWKPAAAGFHHVENRFRSAKAFIYVADNPLKDFTTPRLLGWRTVRVRRADGLYSRIDVSSSNDADVTVRDLADDDVLKVFE